MISTDQIHPFIPSQRIDRREKSKDQRGDARKKPGAERADRKRGPDKDHKIDELA